jgi:deoxyribonuclease-4
MRIGTHVSISGGIYNAPKNAARVGAEVFQIFTRSPLGGPPPEITNHVKKKFQEEMKIRGFDTFYIHAPYFINLASEKNNIFFGSVSIIRQELERGNLLGARAVITHIGSYRESGKEKGIEKVVSGIHKILDGYEGKTKLYLEISAGAGNEVVGGSFEELAEIIFHPKIKKYNLDICFDSCHAFASGYDLRTKKTVLEVLDNFDKVIGLDKIAVVHVNDSKGDIGKRLDRHDHIGKGKIGLEGFKVMLKQDELSKLDWILETPKHSPADDLKNIAILKKYQ